MFTWNEDRIWSLLIKRVYENTEVALCDWLLILKISWMLKKKLTFFGTLVVTCSLKFDGIVVLLILSLRS